MPKIRHKAPTKQRPRDPGSRCGACGHIISAGDKFCTGCGKPLTGAAPAAAPQKQKQRLKTKPAAPRMKKRKPITVPPRMKKRKPITVPPRMKKRKPITVPAAAPQAQKQKTKVAPAISVEEQKRYLENLPGQFYCSSICRVKGPDGPMCPNCGNVWVCKEPVSHFDRSCPRCGIKFEKCIHKDGQKYDPEECIAYHEWMVQSKGQAGDY